MTIDRMASSVATPPALRITWASPSFRPRILWTSRRASMHARTARCLAGGIGRLPLSKLRAYPSLLRSSVSVTLIWLSPVSEIHALSGPGRVNRAEARERSCAELDQARTDRRRAPAKVQSNATSQFQPHANRHDTGSD